MNDDFLNSLNYQVKEEVVNNYLHERLIIEEEIEEYREALEKYRTLEAEVQKARDDLACLLVTPENFQKYFQYLGFQQPPLARLGPANAAGRPPTCPAGLSPKGFTNKGKYLKLTFQTYAILHQKAEEAGQAAEAVLALAEEINQDIKNFNKNHDIITIISFLKSMDIDLVTKKKFLAGSERNKHIAQVFEDPDKSEEKSRAQAQADQAAESVRFFVFTHQPYNYKVRLNKTSNPHPGPAVGLDPGS